MTVIVDAPAGSGTGLLAQYFNDAGSGIYFTALALTRTDPTVDFDWASSAPDPAVQADNFSVRWSGQVMAPVTGTYTFTTTSDDGVRLYVNGQLLIDNWTDHAVVQNSGTIALVANQRYDIRMDFYDRGDARDGQAVLGVPGPDPSNRAAVGAVPRASGQSTAHRRCGCGQDDHAARRRVAERHRTRRWSAGPGLTTTWSKISGREDSAGGTVTFGNPNAPVTTATFGADGIYVLRLTVSDGAVTVSDDVTITVNPAPPNTAPVVNAGADRTITLPCVDDAGRAPRPTMGCRLRRRSLRGAGRKVSGPGTVTFSSPTTLSRRRRSRPRAPTCSASPCPTASSRRPTTSPSR